VCGSLRVKRNGRSRHGRQRWFCDCCNRTFGWRRPSVKHANEYAWFRQWIEESYTFRQLALRSRHSVRTIRRIVEYWLLRPPNDTSDLSGHRYLIFDGTNLEGRQGLFAAMDGEKGYLLRGACDMSEGSRDLLPFCMALRERSLVPQSATVDGNPQLIRTLRMVWPGIIIQRCLVHVQRQGLSWCRRFPKRTDARHLRELFLRVMSIHRFEERDHFLDEVARWEQHYGVRIATSAETGWVFSDLRRARSMLLDRKSVV
jgi:putative transposase